MIERLSKLDDKVDHIHNKMFKDNIVTSTIRTAPSSDNIESKIETIEQQVDDVRAKFDSLNGLISSKFQKPASDDGFSVNSLVTAMNDGMTTHFSVFSDAIDAMNEKIQQNKNLLVQNSRELTMIKEYFSIKSKKNENNVTTSKQKLQQQSEQRKERGLDESMLISEVLRMVRNRLKGDNNENRNTTIRKIPVFVADSLRTISNISSTTLHGHHSPISDDDPQSSTLANSSSRKNGLIFPSIKNKPPKINTTSMGGEAVNFKDAKVNLFNFYARQLTII